jgi:hypothetical protein
LELASVRPSSMLERFFQRHSDNTHANVHRSLSQHDWCQPSRRGQNIVTRRRVEIEAYAMFGTRITETGPGVSRDACPCNARRSVKFSRLETPLWCFPRQSSGTIRRHQGLWVWTKSTPTTPPNNRAIRFVSS